MSDDMDKDDLAERFMIPGRGAAKRQSERIAKEKGTNKKRDMVMLRRAKQQARENAKERASERAATDRKIETTDRPNTLDSDYSKNPPTPRSLEDYISMLRKQRSR